MASKTVAALLSDLEVTGSPTAITTSTQVSASTPPAKIHYGHAVDVASERSAALAAVRARHPERFTTTDPRILALPGPAWINKPKDITEQSDTQLPLVPFSLKNSADP